MQDTNNTVLWHLGRVAVIAFFLVALCVAVLGCSTDVETAPAVDVEPSPVEVEEAPEPFEVRKSITVTAPHERFFVRASCPGGTEIILSESRCFVGGPGTLALDDIEQRRPNAFACQGLLVEPYKVSRLTAIAVCVEVEE